MAEVAVAPALLTAEEFLALPERGDGTHVELVEGRVVAMPSPGGVHNTVNANLTAALQPFVRARRLGRVMVGETDVLIRRGPDTVRCPDVAFWTLERLPEVPAGYVDRAPDLVIEVVSPSDRKLEVYAKMQTWLAAGSRVGWIVWPADQTVEVCYPDRDTTILGAGATLTCPELLPGFELPVADVFDY